jgi:hypothetical protein
MTPPYAPLPISTKLLGISLIIYYCLHPNIAPGCLNRVCQNFAVLKTLVKYSYIAPFSIQHPGVLLKYKTPANITYDSFILRLFNPILFAKAHKRNFGKLTAYLELEGGFGHDVNDHNVPILRLRHRKHYHLVGWRPVALQFLELLIICNI